MVAAPEAQAEDESVRAAVGPEVEAHGHQPSLSPLRSALDPHCMSTVICPLYRQGMGTQRSWACTEVPAEGREAGVLQGSLPLSCLGNDGAAVGVGHPAPPEQSH